MQTPTKRSAGDIRNAFSPKLPVSTAQQYKEDETVEEDAHKEFRRPAKERKVLTKTSPLSVTTSVVDKWIKDTVNRDKQKIVKSQIAEMTKYYNTLQKEEKAELQAIAVDWGLPVKLAASADFNQLVKVISVAIHLTK